MNTKLRKFLDKYHKGFYIEKYIINDGKKHPVAIICPGGGYHWVCSFSEGLPYAQKLNSMGSFFLGRVKLTDICIQDKMYVVIRIFRGEIYGKIHYEKEINTRAV